LPTFRTPSLFSGHVKFFHAFELFKSVKTTACFGGFAPKVGDFRSNFPASNVPSPNSPLNVPVIFPSRNSQVASLAASKSPPACEIEVAANLIPSFSAVVRSSLNAATVLLARLNNMNPSYWLLLNGRICAVTRPFAPLFAVQNPSYSAMNGSVNP
jgi:hypothetical protein